MVLGERGCIVEVPIVPIDISIKKINKNLILLRIKDWIRIVLE
jgi:hypothetical protein